MELLKIDRDFTSRYLNEGFSGGEKKRAEILQMAMLEAGVRRARRDRLGPRHRRPADRLRRRERAARPRARLLIITHYTRILGYVTPDFVHIMLDGRIVREGGAELADELEEKGYEWVREEVAASAA